jgi:hypothetical protein
MNPKYGSWWEKVSHLSNASKYNQMWSDFIKNNPNATLKQVLKFGKTIAKQFKLETNF